VPSFPGALHGPERDCAKLRFRLEVRQRFLRNIKDAARLAGHLVDDLLSFSQMGRAALRPAQVDMNDLVRACIDKLSIALRRRDVRWEIAALRTVHADAAGAPGARSATRRTCCST
jgi:light-regulated signal transduction histidine kinase (bacteriophytochrome)